MKTGTETLIKFKRLQRRLQMPLWQCKGLLQSIWDFTAREARKGDIGRFSDEDIAFAIEWEGCPHELVEALVETGWLDENEDHRVVVHHWPQHCEHSVHVALARKGDVFADGTLPSLTRIAGAEKKALLERFPHLNEDDGPLEDRVAGKKPSQNGVKKAPESAPERKTVSHERTRAHTSAQKRPALTDALADTEALAFAKAEADTEAEARPKPRPSSRVRSRSGSACRDPVSVGSVVSAFLDSAGGAAGIDAVTDRLIEVSRDPPEYHRWWAETAMLMAEHEGFGELEEALKYAEDCDDEGVRKAKDLGPLKKPGAYIAERCKRWLHKHGKRLPKPP